MLLQKPTVQKVLDILTEQASPRDALTMFDAHDRFFSRLEAVFERNMSGGFNDSVYRAMCILLDAAETKGVVADRIRAACHLIWGQPCYAGRGALSLCDNDHHQGALTQTTEQQASLTMLNEG
jgi:hypothetical protein